MRGFRNIAEMIANIDVVRECARQTPSHVYDGRIIFLWWNSYLTLRRIREIENAGRPCVNIDNDSGYALDHIEIGLQNLNLPCRDIRFLTIEERDKVMNYLIEKSHEVFARESQQISERMRQLERQQLLESHQTNNSPFNIQPTSLNMRTTNRVSPPTFPTNQPFVATSISTPTALRGQNGNIPDIDNLEIPLEDIICSDMLQSSDDLLRPSLQGNSHLINLQCRQIVPLADDVYVCLDGTGQLQIIINGEIKLIETGEGRFKSLFSCGDKFISCSDNNFLAVWKFMEETKIPICTNFLANTHKDTVVFVDSKNETVLACDEGGIITEYLNDKVVLTFPLNEQVVDACYIDGTNFYVQTKDKLLKVNFRTKTTETILTESFEKLIFVKSRLFGLKSSCLYLCDLSGKTASLVEGSEGIRYLIENQQTNENYMLDSNRLHKINIVGLAHLTENLNVQIRKLSECPFNGELIDAFLVEKKGICICTGEEGKTNISIYS